VLGGGALGARARVPDPRDPGTRPSAPEPGAARVTPAPAVAGPVAALPSAPSMEVDPLAPPSLTTQVRDGRIRLRVRLLGSSGPRRTSPYRSGPSEEGATATPTLVRLGDGPEGPLRVDLALAPDVVTLTGAPEARRPTALALARRLGRAGVPVTVVGEALGGVVPSGCVRIADPADLAPAVDSPVTPVVICAGPDDRVAAMIRRLPPRSASGPVVILVGGVPPARWSIEAATD
jgi:hypothetical protein